MNRMIIDNIDNYVIINKGTEGNIRKYNDNYVIKEFRCNRVIKSKYSKIKSMMKYTDESFCFPLGPVMQDDKFIGYYMNYIDSNETFDNLRDTNNLERIKEQLIKASQCIERIHQKKVYIYDFNLKNIIINNENPIFVDTDNYKIRFHKPEFIIGDPLYAKYGEKYSDKNIDIFSYTLAFLQILCDDYELFDLFEGNNLSSFINKTDLPQYVKEGIIQVLSDSKDKPYLHYMLKDVEPKRLILK